MLQPGRKREKTIDRISCTDDYASRAGARNYRKQYISPSSRGLDTGK